MSDEPSADQIAAAAVTQAQTNELFLSQCRINARLENALSQVEAALAQVTAERDDLRTQLGNRAQRRAAAKAPRARKDAKG